MMCATECLEIAGLVGSALGYRDFMMDLNPAVITASFAGCRVNEGASPLVSFMDLVFLLS
jgi:hypothetical protein